MLCSRSPRTFLHKTRVRRRVLSRHLLISCLLGSPKTCSKVSLRLWGRARPFKRFGEENDGGYLHCMDSLQPSTLRAAYSMGVEQHDQWSLDVFNAFNIPIFQYDCTVSTPSASLRQVSVLPSLYVVKGIEQIPGEKTTWTLKEGH